MPSQGRAGRKKCHAHFPCCCDMPLEIAVQMLCVLDMISSTVRLVTWCAFLGLDLFANRKLTIDYKTSNATNSLTKPFQPPKGNGEDLEDKQNNYWTTTTTEAPLWTLPTSTTQIPLYDRATVDISIVAKEYSKIANITLKKHDFIEKKENCGEKYLENYLFTYQLFKTRDLWHEFLMTSIATDVFFLVLAFLMLLTVCCFIIHKGSKVLVIIFTWMQWVPIFMSVYAIILSQSQRLCIFEYAWAHKGFKGQTFLKWMLLIRLLVFKVYELLVVGCYIKWDLLQYGYLTDEAIIAPEEEPKVAQKYFKEFYELEAAKGHDVKVLKDTNIANPIEYDGLDSTQVNIIQREMHGPDLFSQRQDDLRRVKATGGDTEQLKSIRKT